MLHLQIGKIDYSSTITFLAHCLANGFFLAVLLIVEQNTEKKINFAKQLCKKSCLKMTQFLHAIFSHEVVLFVAIV